MSTRDSTHDVPTSRPNILLITTDQQHFDAIGTRTSVLETPNLDRLAGEGVQLDRAYCPNPLCSPSRSSIITGQYPSTHGCWTIGTKLDEEHQNLGQIFGEHGYATSLIGKAHFQPLASQPDQTSLEAPPTLQDLDFWRGFTGPYYGFDHIELARNHADEKWVGQHYALWMESKGLENWRDFFQTEDPASAREHSWDLPQEFHYTNFVRERTIADLEKSVGEGKPFFTWASFHDPHPPYLVPEPWASMYDPADVEPGRLSPGELANMPIWHRLTQEENPDYSPWQETPYSNHGFGSHLIDDDLLRKNIAIYYGMISFIDQAVGEILDRLDALGVAQDTIVVFTTDHGHFLGQHGLIAKGAFHYEDLLRVPMIARFPGRIPAGTTTSSLLSLIDLAPTFLAAAGIDVPESMQGVNQLPVWAGDQGRARDHVLVENRHQPTKVHIRTYVDERYKITLYRGRDAGEMFDLQEDPGEIRNLYDDPEYADLRAELLERFMDAELVRETSKYRRIAVA
ncbi:phosphonate monoester hydrolase [Paraoerskovia sediminicola]|uniref:Phosphonate monoester hydrolase n=1 Tax=Paraoerskovia sediminicola TaxID=1138587 RepID=A0ABN6XEN4_9CELL|nr:sulfatase-like hydrolase/transferase [Paraoerskovia sediminicola]BDZ41933.1 phosphonate monoester hydrolase [Paraoerskovia sediminicola]